MDKNSKIFCIGLSRTGTSSLSDALTAIGVNSIHAPFELYDKPFNEQTLLKYQAFSDLPIPIHYKSYAERFPDAKFILTLRNREKWLKSMKWLFANGRHHYNFEGSGWEKGGVVEQMNTSFYRCKKFEKAKLSRFYDEYHDDVDSYFANHPERLLTLELPRDFNFEKLCPFLNVPIPPFDFPHSNPAPPITRFQSMKRAAKNFLDCH